MSFAVLNHLLVGIGAGQVAARVDPRRREDRIAQLFAQRLAAVCGIAVVVEAEEAGQRVVDPELTDARIQLELVGEVKRQVGECRIVAVGAIHLRKIVR